MKSEMSSADVETAVAKAIQEGDCCSLNLEKNPVHETRTTKKSGVAANMLNCLIHFAKRMFGVRCTLKQPSRNNTCPNDTPALSGTPVSTSVEPASSSWGIPAVMPAERAPMHLLPLYRLRLRSIDGRSCRTIEVTERPTPGVCVKHDADCFRVVTVKKSRRTTTTPQPMPLRSSCCQDTSLFLQEVRVGQGA